MVQRWQHSEAHFRFEQGSHSDAYTIRSLKCPSNPKQSTWCKVAQSESDLCHSSAKKAAQKRKTLSAWFTQKCGNAGLKQLTFSVKTEQKLVWELVDDSTLYSIDIQHNEITFSTIIEVFFFFLKKQKKQTNKNLN